ncbi:hypothetical protein [Rhodopseudomonas sp.]|uniref:hypothetical protein n=1 Tax=Rhodopseudomonas sp. TaxID=1078 RepID=UPI003B3A013B
MALFPRLAAAQSRQSDTVRIGYQRSSTLIAILKANGEPAKAPAPPGVEVTWNELTSGLPLLESINVSSIDFGAHFKDMSPAYLTPGGRRAAFVSHNVDTCVAWDPFITSTLHQTKTRILVDGLDGLATRSIASRLPA